MVCIPLILVTGICGIICTFASDKRIRIMMKKTITIVLWAMACINFNAQGNMKQVIQQTDAGNALGEFAPEFAPLNNDVLFGEVWNRQDELSLHQRSLVPVRSLMAPVITYSSLKYHLM